MTRSSLLALIALPLALQAGEGGPWSMGARGHAGFLVPHSKSIWVMVDRHAWAVELHYQRPFSGKKAWHGNYVAPRWGVSAMWLDAGSDHLGGAIHLLPYLELPLVPPGAWEFNVRMGWGLGFVERPFHRVDNFKQRAIGSQIDLAALAAIGLRRQFGRNALDLGVGMVHQSNGAMQQPNLGINVATLSLGYSRRLCGPPPGPLSPDTTWRKGGRTIVYAMANVGWNEVEPVQSGRRSVWVLSSSVYHRVTARTAVGAGADLFNKGTVAVMDTSLADDPRLSYTQVGLHAGGALLFGDMALYLELGAYLHSPVQERADVYTRVGMRHQLNRRLFANFGIKSHLFVADHFELGLGYCIR